LTASTLGVNGNTIDSGIAINSNDPNFVYLFGSATYSQQRYQFSQDELSVPSIGQVLLINDVSFNIGNGLGFLTRLDITNGRFATTLNRASAATSSSTDSP
jgi:hypothetical protein